MLDSQILRKNLLALHRSLACCYKVLTRSVTLAIVHITSNQVKKISRNIQSIHFLSIYVSFPTLQRFTVSVQVSPVSFFFIVLSLLFLHDFELHKCKFVAVTELMDEKKSENCGNWNTSISCLVVWTLNYKCTI